jgi:hypothetical protein
MSHDDREIGRRIRVNLEQQLRHMASQLDGSLISLDGSAAVIELPFLNIHHVFPCWANTNFVGSISSLGEIDRDGTKYIRLQVVVDPTIWVPDSPHTPPNTANN